MVARVLLGFLVLAAAVFLVVLAAVVRTHTCDVSCNTSTFVWAQALAVAGGVVGCVGLLATRPSGGSPEDRNRVLPALAAALCVSFTLYAASLGLLLALG